MRQQDDPSDEALGNHNLDADNGICHGYLSDKSDDELQNDEWNHLEDDTPETDHRAKTPTHPTSPTNVIPPPAQKQQKLDVPACVACKKAQEVKAKLLQKGLLDIEKLIALK
jgi:hypothetical protein